jgi:BASS family bile acid:Na+ symporter
MDIPVWLMATIRVSVVLNVLAVGLRATPRDAAYLLGRPGLLARSLASMYLVMPAMAAGMIVFLPLKPAVEVALLALSLSPIPPILPRKILKAGGRQDYTVGLLAAASLLSVILVPAALHLLTRFSARPLAIPPGAVLKLMLVTVLAPLAAGIVLRRLSPGLAERLARPAGLLGSILLAAAFLPLLSGLLRPMRTLIGDGTLAAFAGFCLAGLAAGALLGGPRPDRRVVLAFCTASRHPGMAMAIALANFPDQALAPVAVVLYLLVNLLVTALYGAGSRHPRAATPAGTGPGSAPAGGEEGLKPA